MSARMKPLAWALGALMSLGILLGIHTPQAMAASCSSYRGDTYYNIKCNTSRQYRAMIHCRPPANMEWYYGTAIRTYYGSWKKNNVYSTAYCAAGFTFAGGNVQYAA